MRKNKKIILIVLALAVVAVAAFFFLRSKRTSTSDEVVQEISPSRGSIRNIISATGSILPKNRLEIMPPVSGRVESILVQEGEQVSSGQTLATMSSTDRAALLDAARGKGEEALAYWKEVYKAIPLISPISGEVIVATVQPGQTVTTSLPIVVLSDQLIVRAQVDETDVGKIKLGQKAVITLDAYPNEKINAVVGHIYYESETVNNVTVYKVDLIPEKIPDFFRSGMNASVDFIIIDKENVLLIPVDAVHKQGGRYYCFLKSVDGKEPEAVPVTLGITDDKNYEVLSGITASDTLLMTTQKYSLPGADSTGTNPFLPKMPRMRGMR